MKAKGMERNKGEIARREATASWPGPEYPPASDSLVLRLRYMPQLAS